MRRRAFVGIVGSIVIGLLGCDGPDPSTPSSGGGGKEVIVYTSVDQPVAKPILDEFTKRTGIKVLLKTDAETSKTAGLVETIRAEKANPQCDVFWNNEVFHSVRLADEGLLAAYESPAAKDLPAQFRDPQHRWAAGGLRFRMIAVGPKGESVTTVEQLANPALKGRVGIANPAFGTTSGHIAALFVSWGAPRAEQFLRDLKANDVKLLGGNGEVVKQIAAGNIHAGLTDNDDIDAMLREGGQLKGVPARTKDDPGTLAIPCTVGLVTGSKRPAEAKQLIDYLLSAEVEQKMVAVNFAKASVRQSQAGSIAAMKVDYAEIAKAMPRAVDAARRILEGRE
jgi:iron(III) transport system substrate-binding protein